MSIDEMVWRELLWGGARPHVLGSLVAHVGLLAAVAMLTPPLGDGDDDFPSDEQRHFIQHYVDALAEREAEELIPVEGPVQPHAEMEGGTGSRAHGEEGSMGEPTTRSMHHRYAVAGPADNPDPHIARRVMLRDAASFGVVGLLDSGAGSDPDAPTAPWGQDDMLGRDPRSARGSMWGDSIGPAFGAGGLGLSGIGEGGGGRGEGIGLGAIGTIGHGAGTGSGQGIGRGHRARPPRISLCGGSLRRPSGCAMVSGRLPPEVVQRIVRQNFGRFRMCYQRGLQDNPNLTGTVTVRFVIGRDGLVSHVGSSSNLPDSEVTSCVTRAFYGLTFPAPEGGIVTVSYPITLIPSG